MTFASVNEAIQLWIKGRGFTAAHLEDEYKEEDKRYASWGLAIFHLAPQDYRWFHS